MPYLTPDTIDPLITLRLVMVSITPELIGAIDDGICRLNQAENWEKHGALTVDQVTDYFLGVCAQYINMSLIGMILPYATPLPPSFALPCDGSIYLKSDYPTLYAALAPAFIIDIDSFQTPDLRDRALVGSGGSYAIGDRFGENSHTLTLAEMPTHTHADLGHAHTESAALPTAITIGLGIPVPSAIPAVSVTGIGNANNQNEGGGAAHENRQPSLVGGYCIVAY